MNTKPQIYNNKHASFFTNILYTIEMKYELCTDENVKNVMKHDMRHQYKVTV